MGDYGRDGGGRWDRDRRGPPRRYTAGIEDQVCAVPLRMVAKHLGELVTISFWEGKKLRTTEGKLASFDDNGNVVLLVEGRTIWYRGATVQSINVSGGEPAAPTPRAPEAEPAPETGTEEPKAKKAPNATPAPEAAGPAEGSQAPAPEAPAAADASDAPAPPAARKERKPRKSAKPKK